MYLFLCSSVYLFHSHDKRLGTCHKLWRIGALHAARAGLILTSTVRIVGGLHHVLALCQTAEEIVGLIILRLAVISPSVTGCLLQRFEAGSTLVCKLNEVVIALCCYGKTNRDAVAKTYM